MILIQTPCRKHFQAHSLFMTYQRGCNWSKTTVATSETGTVYTSAAPGFCHWIF